MIAFSTGSLHNYGMNRAFELAKQAGFDGVEVLIDERWDTRQASYLQHLQAEHEMPIFSLHSPFVRKVEGWEGDAISRVKRSVELAEVVGAGVVVIHLPFRFLRGSVEMPALWLHFTLGLPLFGDNGYRRWLLGELKTYQAGTKVTIAVENMPVKRFLLFRLDAHQLNSLDDLGRFPHLTLDTTHLATRGIDILEAYDRLAGKVAHVHLSNYNGQEHRLLTDGHLPLGELLRRLKRDGYPGVVVVELAPCSLEAGDEGKVRSNLRSCVEFCRCYYG